MFTGVREHVGAVFDGPLVAGAGAVDGGHERRAAERRHGVVGCVVVLRWIPSGFLWLPGKEPAGSEVPVLGARAGGWPLVVAAPAVLAHHEDLDGRRRLERRIVALEGGVEPAEVPVGEVAAVVQEVSRRAEAEVQVAEGAAEVSVDPGSDEQAWRTHAGLLGAPYHGLVLPDRLAYKAVVPAADVEGRDVYLVVPVVYVEEVPPRVLHAAPEVVPGERDPTVGVGQVR